MGVGVFEFEPAFEVFSPKSEWDSNSILVTFDSSSAEYNFNWITFENRDFDSKLGSGLIGFTFGASPSTLVIMGFQYDLHGTNNPKGMTYTAAFTFMI